MRSLVRAVLACLFLLPSLAIVSPLGAQTIDWSTVPLIAHSAYQAVDANGSSIYPSSGFPIRLQGIVLNNNEDWLDPTARLSDTENDLCGQAEFYVQAIVPGDFGGTSCWMAQAYGNLDFIGDPDRRYDDSAWYGELDRLKLYRPGTPPSAQLVRAGDLVEIDARAGLSFAGKMNVNEKHQIDSIFDFEVVLLQKDYGLPAPVDLVLGDLKNATTDQYIFDSTRQNGGEHYQSTLVKIKNVRLAGATAWGPDANLILTDAAGLILPVHLGLNASFSTTAAPTGYFDVVGILDQFDYSNQSGYRLLAMNAGDFVSVPEPATILLLAAASVFSLFCCVVCRRWGKKS